MPIELGIYAELYLSCGHGGQGGNSVTEGTYLVPGVGVETMSLKGMGQCKVGIVSKAESMDEFSK